MRGEVLHYDEAQGFGFITGVDGNRYTFRREDLAHVFRVVRGTQVEFQEDGAQARRVMAGGGSEPTLLDPVPMPPPMPRMPPPPVPGSHEHFGRDTGPLSPTLAQTSGGDSVWGYFWGCLTANYANFSGRARRKEYWSFVLFWWIGLLAVFLPMVMLEFNAAIGEVTYDYSTSVPMWPYALAGLFVLGSLVPAVAVSVRRQHDIGLSGWFFLVVLIPTFGMLILFIFSLIPSQKQVNRWGAVPAGIDVPPAPFVRPA